MMIFFLMSIIGCGDSAKPVDTVKSSEISDMKRDVNKAKKKLDCLALMMEDKPVDDVSAKECEVLINTK